MNHHERRAPHARLPHPPVIEPSQPVNSLFLRNMDIFRKICFQLGLGTLRESPRQLSGGFMHRMYALVTDRGSYAVKLLNPHIMARPTAMDNFRRAEMLESQLEAEGIDILPALIFNGQKMQKIDGQFFYLFDFFDGHALKDCEIAPLHCRKIGKILAQIHGIERREAPFERGPLDIDWDNLIDQLSASHPDLHALLSKNRHFLHKAQSQANAAFANVPAVQTICHGDMDCKNVLWRGTDCRVIDLECLGWSNPFIELYELALCWSGFDSCNVDPTLFGTLICSYAAAGGILPTDWRTIHDANCGRLEWLEYNIQRALGIGCSEEEIALGVSETRKTIAQIAYYQKIRDQLPV